MRVARPTRSARGVIAPVLFGLGRKKTAAATPRNGPPPADVIVERRADGAILLRSPLSLPPLRRSLPHLFDEIAQKYPDRAFMRQRRAPSEPWREISYRDAARQSRSMAQWLINGGLEPGGAVAILSGPSIEHAVFMLAAQRCGAAVAPLSVAYSLIALDLTRLQECVARSGAAFVFADDATAYARAFNALAGRGVRLIAARGETEGLSVTPLQDLIEAREKADVSRRMEAITLDTIARIIYTSGSTGAPKATPQTQNCLMTTVAQCEALGLLEFGGVGPQHLEAMPFSHIMAGNFNFNNVVAAGGTIWIDDGKPTPQLFHHTIANLREFSPHFFLTVPIGFAMLCDAMEQDTALRDRFFANLVYIGFGGAVLSDQIMQRLNALSIAARGRTTPIYAFYGATEFLFGALRWWPSDRMDVIGLPLPAGDLKLAPVGEKLELRVRGPTVMPRSGYLGDAGASEALFDEEGYFRSGDAVRFLDASDPKQGLVFDGRLAEEFKLATGTWVSVGPLRADLVSACDPLVREAVVCGLNQNEIGVLLWLNEGGVRAQLGAEAEGLSVQELAHAPGAVSLLRERIEAFNKANPGSARRIARALAEVEPLSYDAGEVTDKGNANQRRVRSLREQSVMRLYADPPDAGVLRF